jgi:hypothetical protein
MSIQLVDNFYLNSSTPLDNRFVVGSQSFYTNRHDIDWKYVGMRVWDLNDGIPYVWDGSTYSSENSVSISGSGTVNKIPKFATSTTVTDSLIYDDGTYVGISNTTPVYNLDVTGAIRTTDGFIGNGATISNINADNITSGTLLLNRISNSSNPNWLLTSGSGGPGQSTWVNPTAITVGNATNAINSTNATNASNVNVTTTSLNSSYNLVFATTTGNTIIYTNTTNAPKINPSTGNVGIGTGTSTISTKLRIIAPATSQISAAWNDGYTNFLVSANSVSTYIFMRRFSGGGTQSSYWQNNGTTIQDEIHFAGKAQITVDGTGTSDSRLLNFGSPGSVDQIQFYMSSNSGTVSNVGGYGVYIENNLRVDGIVSANKYDLLSSTYSSVSLTFAGASPVAITPVLATDHTTYFWFGGSYTYLYLEVENSPNSGTFHPVFRVNDGVSNQKYGAVIVPKGCKVRIYINATGGATGYYKKFGIT